MNEITLCDRLPVNGLRVDSAGNLVGVARAARTGIQEYAGYELGMPDKRVVRVYRPPEEVFSRDSMRTFAGAPVTIHHPGELVDPSNWRDHAVGETASDDIVRDGESVKVPFLIRDAAGQEAIKDGLHEVSMGYTSMLDFTSGTVPDGHPDAGKAYDAVQRKIRINHLAIVDKARGGPTLRIGDSDDRSKKMKTIIVDGLQVEVTDQAEAAIQKLQGKIAGLEQTVQDRDTALADANKAKGELEGKVTALEQKVKDATDPKALQEAAAARAALCDQAKRLVPKIVTDGKTDAEIRRAVVEAKLGDAGKAMTDENVIAGAFSALAANAPAAGSPVSDGIGNIVITGASNQIEDAVSAVEKAKAARLARFANGGVDPVQA